MHDAEVGVGKRSQRQGVIAVVFDFDDTLAHDSTSSFLDSIDVDVKAFWDDHKKLLADAWDPIPAYLNMMLTLSRQRSARQRITEAKLAGWGKKIQFQPGVSGIFDRIRRQARSVHPGVAVEFYIISSGIGEIIRHTSIARHFTDIWASDFSYNRTGEIEALKNVISFTDKTRFIFQISKGLIGDRARRDPFEVNRKVAPEKLRVPLDQIIFVGDGYTDIPCFSLAQRNGGIAIAVYDRENRGRWGKAWGFIEDNRVQHLVAADYRKKSGLDDALSLAIHKIAGNIALRPMTYQG